MKAQVLYIDEEPMALRIMGRRLQRAFGNEVDVIPILPQATIPLMLEQIRSYVPLVSIVIDQKLTAAGGASYVGTELANAVRRIDHKMPLYILTNVAEDLDANLADVEYILSKDDISDDAKLNTVANRLRRHINVFDDILTGRERRFEELLRKKYANSLDVQEDAEFSELSFQRERQMVVSELVGSEHIDKKLDEAEKKLADIKAFLTK
jgi:hypothetical protein